MTIHTYNQRAEAWLGDQLVIIPDAVNIGNTQRAWDDSGNKPFIAHRKKDGRPVLVRLDGEAYDLHGPGTGDCIVRRA